MFELSPSNGTWTLSTLYSFSGNWGPIGSLAIDSTGNLYGTTNQDGAYLQGSIFMLTKSGGGWRYSTLHDFTGGSDGGQPYGGPVLDANGNAYGTASVGGMTGGLCFSFGCGVVWESTP